MAEYIEVESLKKQLIEKGFYPVFIKHALETIPAADVIEVKHGQWLPQRLLGKDIVDCSECKTIGSPQWGWCPVCGAKMAAKVIVNSNHCVSCGAEIPEGIMVCPSCERRWE